METRTQITSIITIKKLDGIIYVTTIYCNFDFGHVYSKTGFLYLLRFEFIHNYIEKNFSYDIGT